MNNTSQAKDPGRYIVLNGQTLDLTKNQTDFTVLAPKPQVSTVTGIKDDDLEILSAQITRAHTNNSQARDDAMATTRQTNVAHHIYEVDGTKEEVIIDDHLILKLIVDNPILLQEIIEDFKLEFTTQMGDAYVLRLTAATGSNPLKVSNEIATREGVSSCAPQLLVPMMRHDTLFREQWYLAGNLTGSPDIALNAGVEAPEAWSITTGNPDIVVAVIDDGFDLGHPSFISTRIHPDKIDFEGSDPDPVPQNNDYHGTPVATIAIGNHDAAAKKGIAPGCTFLPQLISGFIPWVKLPETYSLHSLPSTQTKMAPVF